MKKIAILLVSLVIIVHSCNSGKKKTPETISNEVDIEKVIAAAEAVYPDLKSVDDVLLTLELTEAPYYPILCNDPFNASRYTENKVVAAANLGVYVGDIIYHLYGESTEDMYLSFGAAQELAKSLGLKSEFGATVLTELEAGNIAKDSLIHVFNDLLAKSESYNSGEELMHVHTSFISGLYFEKLYLSASILEDIMEIENPTLDEEVNFKELLSIFHKQLNSINSVRNSIESGKKDLDAVFKLDDFDSLIAAKSVFDEAYEKLLLEDKIAKSEVITNLQKSISIIRTGIVLSGK